MNVTWKKTSTWLASESVNIKITVISIATWVACFYHSIFGYAYTGWDTHDLGFVNFLYFSDALKSGTLPLWNPYIQSGTFFPSFNNIGLYTPFQLIFVGLSWVINPVYLYELMIQSVALIGGVGSFLYFRTYTTDRLIALFGAIAFVISALVPIVGQIGMLVSLSSLPWLIFACTKIIEDHGKNRLSYVIWGIVGGMYLASGYPWMNLIGLALGTVVSVWLLIKKHVMAKADDKSAARSCAFGLLLFIGTSAFVYACLELPGYLSMYFNYAMLNGDFISPEPRLRSMGAQGEYSYANIWQAFIAATDPRIYTNDGPWVASVPRWSLGGGWVLWILFLGVSGGRGFCIKNGIWLGLLVLALMYSSGGSNYVGDLVRNLPIINSNRWWFIGTYYVIIFLVFLCVAKLEKLKGLETPPNGYRVRLLAVLVGSMLILVYFKSPVNQYILVCLSVLLVWKIVCACGAVRCEQLLIAITVVNVISFATMSAGLPTISSKIRNNDYSKLVLEREKSTDITNNNRKLEGGDDYVFNNQEWLLKKKPSLHGYNNLGNPFYWYVKNDPFLAKMVVVTQDIRQEQEFDRKNFASDNKFVAAMMADVLMDMSRPTVDPNHYRSILQRTDYNWQLNDLKIEPNAASMNIRTDGAAFLIFNNVNHPGWEVYVNDNKADLVRVNRVFQGVFLDGSGSYNVVFKFRPILTLLLILTPYLMLVVCLFASIKTRRQKTFCEC